MLAAVILLFVSACSSKSVYRNGSRDEKACAEVLSRYEAACRKLDIEKMLDCYSPDSLTLLRKVFNAASIISSQSEDEIMEFISSLVLGFDAGKDTLKSVRMEISAFDPGEESDSMEAFGHLTYKVGSEEVRMKMVAEFAEVKEEWYLVDIDVSH